MGLHCTPEERAILDTWPVVTAEDIQKMNDLFPHYIFYRSDKEGIAFWASCCGRKKQFDYLRRTELPTEIEFLERLGHNEPFVCPWCGQPVTLKNLRKSGKRKQLETYRLAILLHAREDALYADAAVLHKGYGTGDGLTDCPTYRLSSMYRFSAGEVMEVDYQEGGRLSYEREKLGRRKLVQEPFKVGSVSMFKYEYYAILNQAAVRECPVTRYSGYFEHWIQSSEQKFFWDLVSYLTAYCLYPRQIEMLAKAGLREPVWALIGSRKKFSDAIDWTEPDIRKAMHLTGPELRDVLATKPPMEALALRNLAKRWFGKQWTLREAVDFTGQLDHGALGRSVLRFCRQYKLDPDQLVCYLSHNQVRDPDLIWADIPDLFQIYRDYIETVYQLGLCMEHGKVLWPDDLYAAHDKYVAERTRRMEAELENLEMEKATVKGAARKQKYEFELDGLCVRFPMIASAIRYEGKTLHHCVGGYADRHIKGVLTILFLRRSSERNKPYVTIEMDGDRIVQVHGYGNDRGVQSPRVTHKEFFDTWLAWLKAGSKRDKDGKPVLPGKRKTETA